MGEVLVAFKVMPKTIEIDLDSLEKKIREAISPDKVQRNPIAFGIVAFNVTKIIPDASGELEKIENKLKSIDLVGEVEVTEVMRMI
jgi:elongation factor 1-beta